jgi:hypothetical protein
VSYLGGQVGREKPRIFTALSYLADLSCHFRKIAGGGQLEYRVSVDSEAEQELNQGSTGGGKIAGHHDSSVNRSAGRFREPA